MPTASRAAYPPALIALHWLTLLLLIAVYALIELRGIYPKHTPAYDAMKHWHFMLGLTVLLLTALRLGWRSGVRMAEVVPLPPRWQRFAASTMHTALYIFLLVMPILGWLTLSAKGQAIPFFGIELPALLPADKPLGKNLEEIHETIGSIGYWLIGLHALAALFHHYWLHDNTLRRMLRAS